MGCGAVGGVLAGDAARWSRRYVVNHACHTQALHADGLHLTTPAGRLTVPAERLVGTGALGSRVIHTDLVTVDGPFDIVLLAMKATGVEQATRAVGPLLAADGYAVTLQNGIARTASQRSWATGASSVLWSAGARRWTRPASTR